jgi:hypothetical protein
MESIEEVIFPAMSLVFLLLGLMLLVSILFSSFSPYDQIAFANTEKLQSAINEACITNQPVKLGTFEFSQNIPSMSWILTVLPRWLIRNSGDPNYIIYYQSFPPGEAAGWEVYHPFNNRLVVNLPDGWDGKNGNEVKAYVLKTAAEFTQKNPGQIIDAVVVGNIVLSGSFRSDFVFSASGSSFSPGGGNSGGSGASGTWEPVGGPVTDPSSTGEKFFGYGQWKFQSEDGIPEEGNNQFKFTNYMGLTNLERTLIKYQTCGINSLCLKTRNGIYSYPLTHCSNEIKGIYIAYDARSVQAAAKGAAWSLGSLASAAIVKRIPGFGAIKGIGFLGFSYTIEQAVKQFFIFALGFKISSLNIASPCLLKNVEIRERSCVADYGVEDLFAPEDAKNVYSLCEENVQDVVYTYSAENGLKKTKGFLYTCAEKVGNDVQPKNSFKLSESNRCIEISTSEEAQGFCWTPDPFKKLDSGNFFTALDQVAYKVINAVYSVSPIRDTTDYFSGDTTEGFVLKPTDTTLKKGTALWEALDRKWWWGWPGGLGG